MFDAKRFLNMPFTAREDDVRVPDLRDFFPEGEEPVWRVRGLTGQELGVAIHAAERNKNAEAILDGIASSVSSRKADAIRKLLGERGDVTDDVARRLEMFVMGSVTPEADMQLAVKMCRVYPIEFLQITNAVNKLTGMGQVAKKKPPSSGTT